MSKKDDFLSEVPNFIIQSSLLKRKRVAGNKVNNSKKFKNIKSMDQKVNNR